jgi:hypothetical protein
MSIKQRAANALATVIGWLVFTSIARQSAKRDAEARRTREALGGHPECRCVGRVNW